MPAQTSAFPIGEIETLLMRAQADPQQRDRFYLGVLHAQVFAVVWATEEPSEDGSSRMVTFATVTIDGVAWVPFATSASIFEAQFPGKEPVELKGIDLFMNASPKNFLMNPGTDFVKPFSPDEAEYMLALFSRDGGVASINVREGTNIVLGEPKDYPAALVQKLTAFLPKIPQVQRAWIAQSFIEQDGATPNLMLGLELHGEVDAVMAKLGQFVSPLIPARTAFDMAVVRAGKSDTGVSDYFINESTPFYVAGATGSAENLPKKGFRKFFGL